MPKNWNRPGSPSCTSPDNIDLAEDRDRFRQGHQETGIPSRNCVWPGLKNRPLLDVAARIGYPLMVRPSYVLGGRA
ncbi:MAG: hypothetical protein R2860_05765 [Desulfobacterales bacterium]